MGGPANLPMDASDHKKLSAAVGYLSLGMPDEAADELAEMSETALLSIEARALQLQIAQTRQDWATASEAARWLVARQPETVDWAVALAYAERRHRDIETARDILLAALVQHPAEAILEYNLACYACQLGNLDEARKRLKRAFELDAEYRKLALDDDDLQALRDEDWLRETS